MPRLDSQAIEIDASSSAAQFVRARQVLAGSAGAVMLNGVLILRPRDGAILCEVIDPLPGTRRCAEEFKVLIENAGRALEASRLCEELSPRSLRWSVVAVLGDDMVQVWPD